MHVMQYEIMLPADYDMGIIRHRVATKGAGTDAFPGLGLKAYAIREQAQFGSTVNQYAPFYLWTQLTGMNEFLWGPGFRGLRESFGRPVVQQWTGLMFEPGPALPTLPRTATRATAAIAPDADPTTVIEEQVELVHQRASTPGVHSTALAVDTRRWETVQLTLWEGEAPGTAGTRYEVLHLSAPHLDDLRTGKQW